MDIFKKKPVFFAAAAALFLVLLLVVFQGFVFHPDKLMLNSDQLNGIGSRILRAENVVLTEWDDSRLGGVPTIDALFADAYHPLVTAQFLTDPARAVGFKFILTIWVAFMSAMLLAWNLTKNKWWACLLGLLYAFAPEFFTYIYGGHDGKMMVFAIAPLAILAIRKIVREGSLPYMIVFALSVAWMVLGSHLQLTYLFLWGAGLYTLYEAIFHAKGTATKGKRIGIAAAALFLGLAVASFQLIPPYLYTTTQSVRGTDEKTSLDHASSWSLHQEEMAQMLIPGFIGVDVFEQDPETGDLNGSSMVNFTRQEMSQLQSSGAMHSTPYYWGHNYFKLDHNSAGTMLTFLGFLCLFLPNYRRWAIFWGLGAVVALSYGMGTHSPLFELWYKILPGVKNFRAPGMALFWLPLLLVMMAAPVLKSFEEKENHKYLIHGTIAFVVLVVVTMIARANWLAFLGPLGLIVMIVFALFVLGLMNLDDNEKSLNFTNLLNAYKSGLSNSSRFEQAGVLVGFLFIGLFMLSGQEQLPESGASPLNVALMNATFSKVVPSFILVLVTVGAVWGIFRSQLSSVVKMVCALVIAGIELFFINGAFIQNVDAARYLQPDNKLAAALKAPYKADSINTPRVLSLVRNNPALAGNIFPQYHLRNAAGIHDNELASYQKFRGGVGNANYMININDPEAAHPFLDLMNIDAVLYDTPRGTNFIPNYAAMGEVYLYGEAVVMDDEAAIKTLQTAEVRKAKAQEKPAEVSAEAAPAEENHGFYYKEVAILDQPTSQNLEGGIPQGRAKLVESPKMDTQVYQVESDRPAVMVVAGNYHPYWTAYVNGVETKVIKAFGTLRAVEVPKGKSEVRMEFRSKPFHACLKVSAVALVILMGVGIVFVIRRKK